MSNHSAQYPNGILDKYTLKSFFSITEQPDGTLTYIPGWERIPDIWYRRPVGVANEYTPLSFGTDLLTMSQTVPGVVAVGGNTGTVNSFAGVDLADVTGGAYHNADLLDPPKFVCYFYQILLAATPDILRSRALGGILGTALGLLNSQLAPFIDPECAKIGEFCVSAFIRLGSSLWAPWTPGGNVVASLLTAFSSLSQLQRRLCRSVPRCRVTLRLTHMDVYTRDPSPTNMDRCARAKEGGPCGIRDIACHTH